MATTPTFQHYALTFTKAHADYACDETGQEPLRDAWATLRERAQTGIFGAEWDALRFLLDEDKKAGERAISTMTESTFISSGHFLHRVWETLSLTHAVEMLRTHPNCTDERCTVLFSLLQGQLTALEADQGNDTYAEKLWLAALSLCAGVVLEDETRWKRGVAAFEHAVNEMIRPQGHIAPLVSGEDGGSLYRTIIAVEALVLMAEVATHAGMNLWEYQVRGVSVVTAAMYPIYYFYTPEKWKWDKGITAEAAQEIFRGCGGFLELLYRKTRHKDLKPLLEDLRPITDSHMGGLPTLTHGLVEKRRGLFR